MFCYICIFKAARKQFGRILGNYDENIRVRNMQNVKAIKTVSFVLGVYIITWMPSLVLQSAHSYYMATNHRRKDVKFFKPNPNTNFHGVDFFPESGLRHWVFDKS